MASIQTSIEMQDRISASLHGITNALNLTLTAFQGVQDTVSRDIDADAFAGIRGQINAATLATQQFENELSKIQSPTVEITPVWNIDSHIPIFDNTGLDRLNLEMGSLNDITSQVLKSQQLIGEQALKMDLLPPNASWDINFTNQRIEELGQKIAELQHVDISMMNDDAIARMNSETEALRSSMNAIINLQENMNAALEQGDFTHLNAGYKQLNNIAESTEQRVRANKDAMEQLNNVVWNTPQNIDIFQGNDIVRYKQEVASATQTLNSLRTTQQNISQNASNMKILPPQAVNDIGNMSTRIQALRNQITQVQQSRIEVVGVERANAEVEGLRQQLQEALETQENLNKALNNMDVSAANAAYNQLNSIIDATERNIRDNTNEQQRFNQQLEKGTKQVSGLQNKIAGMTAAYLSIQGVQKVLDLSDTMAQTQARLNLIVDDGGSVQDLQNKIFAASQRANADFGMTADVITKLGMQAGQAFGNNNELIAFSEQLNKTFKIAGTDASGIESTMYNLTQALSSGVLRGQDLNAVFSNAQPIIQNIADYLQVPVGQIREMAADGQLSAEIVKNAMLAAADKTNAKFESIPLTFADIAANIKNEALMMFEPLLVRLNEIANSEAFQVFVGKVIHVIGVVANAVIEVFNMIVGIAQFVNDHLSWLEPVIWTVVVGLGALVTIILIANAVTWLWNAALSANPIVLIAVAILVVIGLIIAWINHLGGLRVVWLIVVNIILTAWDWVKIGFFTGVYWVIDLWNKMQLAMKTAGTAIANCMGDMKTNVLMILQSMVNGAIDIINGFIGVLNKIPGVSMDAVQQVTFGTQAQLANEAEKQVRENALNDYRNQVDAGIAQRAGRLDGMKNDARAATAQRQAEIDQARAAAASKQASNEAAAGLPSFDIPALDGLSDGVKGIGKDTGNIANNTEAIKNTGEQDLKYLRDIAERDAINKFTIAEINFDMGGVTNNVNSTIDLDGVADYIGDTMMERLEIVAEGVYA